jgi:hypothetical protein
MYFGRFDRFLYAAVIAVWEFSSFQSILSYILFDGLNTISSLAWLNP